MTDYSNEEFANKLESICVYSVADLELLQEAAKRLCEPEWIPIDEFMKDPVKGLCWIMNGIEVLRAFFNEDKKFYYLPLWKPDFKASDTHIINITFPQRGVTHVQPIPKPKAPE